MVQSVSPERVVSPPDRRRFAVTVEVDPAGSDPDAAMRQVLDRLRTAAAPEATVHVNGRGPALRIYSDSRRVFHGGRQLDLTRLEFDLLRFLARNPEKVFHRRELLRQVWRLGGTPVGTRTVDVHVRRLRAKLLAAAPAIATVRGVGYRFEGSASVELVGG